MGFPGASVVKNPPANAGDAGYIGLILVLGRSPEGRNGNPLQFSCSGNFIEEAGRLQFMGSQGVRHD